MNGSTFVVDTVVIFLLIVLFVSALGLIIILTLYLLKISGFMKHQTKFVRSTSRSLPQYSRADSSDIRDYGINEILSSGRFSAAERKAEYRRRGKSPSGVIDGIYNDAYRGNESYNDSYRDWDADA
jgi:hypothetical protein